MKAAGNPIGRTGFGYGIDLRSAHPRCGAAEMHYEVRKLPVYAHAKDFAAAIDVFTDALPAFRGYLKDQLRRSALSILLNLAEGATETEPREKARMYRLAGRSAAECGAALDFSKIIVPQLAERAAALDRRASDLTTEIHHLIASQIRRAQRISTRSAHLLAKPPRSTPS